MPQSICLQVKWGQKETLVMADWALPSPNCEHCHAARSSKISLKTRHAAFEGNNKHENSTMVVKISFLDYFLSPSTMPLSKFRAVA